MDQAKATLAATEALRLWQAGSLSEAERRYRDALADADPGDDRTPLIHGEYGGLLTQMRRVSEATQHFERALFLELKRDGSEASPAVAVARYFLGAHYLQMGEPESARQVVAPSLSQEKMPLAWFVEAEALLMSGDTLAARAAAERALLESTSDEQKARIRSRLGELWEHGAGGE